MKKTYWVMKNPGSTAEWLEMDGKQFYDFITSPAGKGRYFMDCDTYEIEVSPEQYRKWKHEANHSDYLKGFEDKVLILSLDNFADGNGLPYHELITDLSVNIEGEVIDNIDLQRLSEAFKSLKSNEQRLITELYLLEKPKTMREMTELTGIPFQTVHFRKNKILEKLKILLDKR